MAKKYKNNKKNSNFKKYSLDEKQAWKSGFFVGLFSNKKRKSVKVKSKKKTNSISLLDEIKLHRQKNLGVLYHNGKYYDTNFIDKPTEISKSLVKDLHKEYDFDGKRSDIEVADSYVRHMRHKYGVFDKDGKFLHMMGEK